MYLKNRKFALNHIYYPRNIIIIIVKYQNLLEMFATFALPRPSNTLTGLVVLLPRSSRLLLTPDPHEERLQLSFVQFLGRVGGEELHRQSICFT